MLVDPSAVDPRQHIRFKLEVARPLTQIGATTIDVLELNREPLLEQRRSTLDHLVQCRRVVEYAAQQGESDDVLDATHPGTLRATPIPLQLDGARPAHGPGYNETCARLGTSSLTRVHPGDATSAA